MEPRTIVCFVYKTIFYVNLWYITLAIKTDQSSETYMYMLSLFAYYGASFKPLR